MLNCMHLVIVASTSWTAALVLTIIATVREQLALVAAMWAALSLSVAIVVSVALLINRAQYEVTSDIQQTIRDKNNGIRMTRL